MVGRGHRDEAFENYVKTLNILPQKTSDALTLLEVDRLTIHMVLKYGIEIRGKTAKPLKIAVPWR